MYYQNIKEVPKCEAFEDYKTPPYTSAGPFAPGCIFQRDSDTANGNPILKLIKDHNEKVYDREIFIIINLDDIKKFFKEVSEPSL